MKFPIFSLRVFTTEGFPNQNFFRIERDKEVIYTSKFYGTLEECKREGEKFLRLSCRGQNNE